MVAAPPHPPDPRGSPLAHLPDISPTCFVPSCPADFMEQADKVAEVMLRKAEALKPNPDRPLQVLVSGSPGIGNGESSYA